MFLATFTSLSMLSASLNSDTFFLFFHSLFVLFIVLGWVWKKTRKINLILILLTAFSWFILGIWYGVGYCPFTEWHWQVRYKLGFYDMPYSYMKFLLDKLTGIQFNPVLVDFLTVVFFISALLLSLYFNSRDWIYAKKDRT